MLGFISVSYAAQIDLPPARDNPANGMPPMLCLHDGLPNRRPAGPMTE
jgi:hypothetical protein